MSCGDIFLGLIAIIFPPIAVWIKRGLCSADSLINILLCVLGYIPGLLHAWYIIARNPEVDHDYAPVGAAEEGRVTYYYVSHDAPRRNYGTSNGQPPANAVRAALPPQSSSQQQGSAPQVKKSSKPKPPQHPASQPLIAGPSVGAGRDDDGAPPSYSEVVKGDNKIQTD